MKDEISSVGQPIPDGLEFGDQFTDEELIKIRKLREILKTSRSSCFFVQCEREFTK